MEAVKAFSTRGPRLTGQNPVSRSIAFSRSSQSPSGPIATATSAAGGIEPSGTVPSSRKPAMRRSGSSPSSAFSSETGGRICGISAAPHCRVDSSNIFLHRASFLGTSSSVKRGTDLEASIGTIFETPASVTPLSSSSKSPPFSREARRTIRGNLPLPGSGSISLATTAFPASSSRIRHLSPDKSPSISSPLRTLNTLRR